MPEPTIDDVEMDETTGMPKLPENHFWRVKEAGLDRVRIYLIRRSASTVLTTHGKIQRERYMKGEAEYEATGTFELERDWIDIWGFFQWPVKKKVPLYNETFLTILNAGGTESLATVENVRQTARQLLFRRMLGDYRNRVVREQMDLVVGDYPPKSLPQETNVAKVGS